MRDRRRPRIAAGNDFPALGLAPHPPRQDRKQNDPPDDEIDGRRGGPGHGLHACSSSTSVPQKSLGWRNRTALPLAPTLGSPLPRMRAPAALSRSRAEMMSSTS